MQYTIVRIVLARIVHKQPLTGLVAVNCLIEGAGDATEKTLGDLKLIPEDLVKMAGQGVITFMKEVAFKSLTKVAEQIAT